MFFSAVKAGEIFTGANLAYLLRLHTWITSLVSEWSILSLVTILQICTYKISLDSSYSYLPELFHATTFVISFIRILLNPVYSSMDTLDLGCLYLTHASFLLTRATISLILQGSLLLPAVSFSLTGRCKPEL